MGGRARESKWRGRRENTEVSVPPASVTNDKVLTGIDWKRVLAVSMPAPRPKGGFTIAEYCDRTNLPITTVRDRLNRLVRTGKLKKDRGFYYIP